MKNRKKIKKESLKKCGKRKNRRKVGKRGASRQVFYGIITVFEPRHWRYAKSIFLPELVPALLYNDEGKDVNGFYSALPFT